MDDPGSGRPDWCVYCAMKLDYVVFLLLFFSFPLVLHYLCCYAANAYDTIKTNLHCAVKEAHLVV